MKSEINYKKELIKGALAGVGATLGTALLFYFMNKGGNNSGGTV